MHNSSTFIYTNLANSFTYLQMFLGLFSNHCSNNFFVTVSTIVCSLVLCVPTMEEENLLFYNHWSQRNKLFSVNCPFTKFVYLDLLRKKAIIETKTSAETLSFLFCSIFKTFVKGLSHEIRVSFF